MTELQTNIPCPACGTHLFVGATIDYDPAGGKYLERWIECRGDKCKHWTDETPLWHLKGIGAWLEKVEKLHYDKYPDDLP